MGSHRYYTIKCKVWFTVFIIAVLPSLVLLGRKGSNLWMPDPNPGALPLGYTPIKNLFYFCGIHPTSPIIFCQEIAFFARLLYLDTLLREMHHRQIHFLWTLLNHDLPQANNYTIFNGVMTPLHLAVPTSLTNLSQIYHKSSIWCLLGNAKDLSGFDACLTRQKHRFY